MFSVGCTTRPPIEHIPLIILPSPPSRLPSQAPTSSAATAQMCVCVCARALMCFAIVWEIAPTCRRACHVTCRWHDASPHARLPRARTARLPKPGTWRRYCSCAWAAMRQATHFLNRGRLACQACACLRFCGLCPRALARQADLLWPAN
jgi:hypothetical protein